MKKLLCLFLVGLLLGLSPLLTPALAQTSGGDLYYTFYGQRIPLVQRREWSYEVWLLRQGESPPKICTKVNKSPPVRDIC